MLARKKSSRYIKQVYMELENFSFTFIDAEDYVASEKWQKIFIGFFYCTIPKCTKL